MNAMPSAIFEKHVQYECQNNKLRATTMIWNNMYINKI